MCRTACPRDPTRHAIAHAYRRARAMPTPRDLADHHDHLTAARDTRIASHLADLLTRHPGIDPAAATWIAQRRTMWEMLGATSEATSEESHEGAPPHHVDDPAQIEALRLALAVRDMPVARAIARDLLSARKRREESHDGRPPS